MIFILIVFFFQAEDGIRDLVRSRGLGDVYKRQALSLMTLTTWVYWVVVVLGQDFYDPSFREQFTITCLLYTSDAADERSSVDLGGRRIIKKKQKTEERIYTTYNQNNRNIRSRINNDRIQKEKKSDK